MPRSAARKIARALGVVSETVVREIDGALNEAVRDTPQAVTTVVEGEIAWGNVTGKPTEFTPAAHTHAAESDILGAGLGNYADDAAAAVGGVEVGGLYRNGSVVMVRVS